MEDHHHHHHSGAVEAKTETELPPSQHHGGDGSSSVDGRGSSDGASSTSFTCKAIACEVAVTAPDTTCSVHAARPRRNRPASARASAAPTSPPQVPAKKPSSSGPNSRPKAALPQTLDALPTATIELSGDASAQKCSYHDCPNRAKVSQSYGVFCNRHAVVFPCGFPGCRDKAPTNGTRCAKHQEQGTTMLDEALAVRSQSIPVCRTKGCFKNDQGRGFCRGHEKLMMATGQLPHAINKRRLNSAYTMCCFPGCGKHSQRNHLCRIHGNDLIKQAQQLVENQQTTQTFDEALATLQRELRRCTHPDCDKNAQRDRLCTTHYHLRGQAEKGLDIPSLALHSSDTSKEKVLKFCSEPQCTQAVYCNWLCQPHYEQREKKSGSKQAASKLSAHSNTGSGSSLKQQPSGKPKPDYLTNNPLATPGASNAASASSGMIDLLDHHASQQQQIQQQHQQQQQQHHLSQQSREQHPHQLYADELSLHDDYGKKPTDHPNHPHHHQQQQQQQHPSDHRHQQPASNTSTSYWDQTSSYQPTSASRHQQLHHSHPLASSYPRYGFIEYNEPSAAAFFQDAAAPYPSSRASSTCANPSCSRQVLGKGVCEMCLGVSPHVHFPLSTFASSSSSSSFDAKPQGPHPSPPPPPPPSASDHFAWPPPHASGSFAYADSSSAKAGAATTPPNATASSFSPPTRACNFDDCQTVTKAPLCLLHSNATLCVAPHCEEMVAVPGLCTDHALDNSCAVPGCTVAILGSNPTTCVRHASAPRCAHSQCYKYATKASHCVLHDGPVDHCKLCALYDMVCPLLGNHHHHQHHRNTSLAKENNAHNNTAASPHFTTLSGHKLSL
ncbi:hypothetical protein B5M09_000748 [Aphanomyces astaci]|uniref:Uncharacterized protein n=1 Tax=Aphanomyces astaci TaxID=112090 RepID=A0A425DCA0_APHAT|nr:hypothetical protein B5M09_000748 [Aphanomyces astaci]